MSETPRFRVIDAFAGPHAGRILRLRLEAGDTPSIRSLKGSRVRAVSPDGIERYARIDGFPLFGGRPSDDRFRKSGRVDVHVIEEAPDADPRIGLQWELTAG